MHPGVDGDDDASISGSAASSRASSSARATAAASRGSAHTRTAAGSRSGASPRNAAGSRDSAGAGGTAGAGCPGRTCDASNTTASLTRASRLPGRSAADAATTVGGSRPTGAANQQRNEHKG
jgi:hypothetical protein